MLVDPTESVQHTEEGPPQVAFHFYDGKDTAYMILFNWKIISQTL